MPLYTLKTRGECAEFDNKYLPDGSFSQIGGRGIDDWLQLGPAEIAVTFAQVQNKRLENWAVNYSGSGVKLYYNGTPTTMNWGILLMSSAAPIPPYVRQKVNVLKFSPDHAWALIDAIPYQASGDYSAFTPDKHPEFWLWAYTDFKNGGYGPSHTFPDGTDATFLMPLFDPASGFKVSSSAKSHGGFWVDARILYQPVPTEVTVDLKVKATALNIRSDALLSAPVVGQRLAGDTFHITALRVDAIDGIVWGYDGTTLPAGWSAVNAAYLE
jgi:hypothetical protein